MKLESRNYKAIEMLQRYVMLLDPLLRLQMAPLSPLMYTIYYLEYYCNKRYINLYGIC